MTIPASVTQLLIVLVLVVPGFVYQVVRIRLRGRSPSDIELSGRVLHAIIGSTMFALAYVIVLGPRVADAADVRPEDVLDHPRLAGLVGFVAAFGVPAIVAALPSLGPVIPHPSWPNPLARLRPSSWTRVDPSPGAWDVAFASAEPGYVRVRLSDGSWYAGYFGENSYASSFPDSRNLFVEMSYKVTDSGEITDQVENSAGAVIDCRDAVLVELLRPGESAARGEPAGSP